jgi:hypothetical protein
VGSSLIAGLKDTASGTALTFYTFYPDCPIRLHEIDYTASAFVAGEPAVEPIRDPGHPTQRSVDALSFLYGSNSVS